MKKFNKNLVEAVNSRGMVVRSLGDWGGNRFGETNIITIEGSTHRITFITNVLNGVNEFDIFQLHDLYNDKVYKDERFFAKYNSLIAEINTEIYRKENKTYLLSDSHDEDNNLEVTLQQARQWLADFWTDNPDEDMTDEEHDEMIDAIMISDVHELCERLAGIDYWIDELDEQQ